MEEETDSETTRKIKSENIGPWLKEEYSTHLDELEEEYQGTGEGAKT